MQLPFSLFLALRYLQPKRSFISVITFLSVSGVTLGITVLVVVISVMTGFEQELRRKVLGFEPHLEITSDHPLENWREMDATARKEPGIIATAPYVLGPVVAEFRPPTESRDVIRLAFTMRGIDPAREESVTNVHSAIIEPPDKNVDLTGDTCVLGDQVARNLGVGVGDKISLYSPSEIDKILKELDKPENAPDRKTGKELRDLILPTELTVGGIFKTGRFAFDSEFIIVPLHIGQELYGLRDAITGLAIKTADPYNAPQIAQHLVDRLPPDVSCPTWIDINQQMFDAVRVERNVMFFVLFFVIIVAAFGIMTTLITLTAQKTREIGILKALGATTGHIVWVFLSHGMIIGVGGNITGLALGMTAVHWRNEFKDWLARTLHIELFPPGIYQFSAIPAEIKLSDVAIICCSAFLLCSVAALIPAFFASKLEPVKALRYE